MSLHIIIYTDGAELGPYHWHQLRSLVDNGTCSWDDYAWHDGMEAWEPLHSVFQRVSTDARRSIGRRNDKAESISFFSQLPRAFIYPFRGAGAWAVHLYGSLLLIAIAAVLSLTVSLPPTAIILLLAAGVLLSLTGYLLSYLFQIVRETVAGKHELSSLPGLGDRWDDRLMPLVTIILVILGSFLPAIGVLLSSPIGSELSDLQLKIALLLSVVGLFYLPMALLATICYNSVRTGLNPLLVIPSIYRILFRYLILVLIQGLVCGGFAWTLFYLTENFPFRTLLLIFPLLFYFIVVQMRILGLIHYTSKDELGWFTHT